MKTSLTFLFASFMFLASCNNGGTENKTASSDAAPVTNTKDFYPYVTAKINGNPWQSVKDEILATHSEIDDKLQIFTKDAGGKMNFLLTLAPFSKTGVGDYNSVREGTAGYGISLLDEDTKDDVVLDYDNFRQGAVAACLHIVSVTETAEGKIVKGSFASPVNISVNYETNKGKLEITDGSFVVLLKK